MRKWYCLLLLWAVCGQWSVVSGQNFHWELGLRGSYVMHNFQDIPQVATGTVDFDVTWLSSPVPRAEGAHNLFSYGVRASFNYMPWGVAGHRFGLVGIVRAPLFSHLDYHLGIGLSAFTRPQSITHDLNNDYISSLLNCLLDVGFDYRVSEHLMLTAALTHSSNGMLHRPNKGLNFFQAGVTYRLGAGSHEPVADSSNQLPATRYQLPAKHEIGFTLSPGFAMSQKQWQEGYFFCYDLSLNYLYHLNNVFAFGATVDLWYNDSYTEPMRRLGVDKPVPVYLSAMPVYESTWGPLSLRGGVGPVLIASPMVRIRFYERLALYYNFGQHYVGAGINAHSGIIEFIEWSYGYRIPIGK